MNTNCRFTKPITPMTFTVGEPGWSVAIGDWCSGIFYYTTALLWWATGSPHVALLGLAWSFALTPLQPFYLARWACRRLRRWRSAY